MHPSLDEIVRYRYLATLIVRIVGIIFFVIGSMFVLLWILEGIRDDDLLYFGYYGLRIAIGASFMAVGMFFFFLGRWMVRVLTPVPEPSCPRCRYALRALASPRCPECGLDFPEGFAPAKPRESNVPAYPPLAPRDGGG